MKKIFNLFTLIFITCLAFVLISCNSGKDPKKDPEKVLVEKVEPTCEVDGYVTYSVDGVEETETLPAPGHSYTYEQKEGYKLGTCSVCGDVCCDSHAYANTENHIIAQKCLHCNHIGHSEGDMSFYLGFNYDYEDTLFDAMKALIAEIDTEVALYKDLTDASEIEAANDSVEAKFETLDDQFEKILWNYFVSNAYFYKTQSETWSDRHDLLGEVYSDAYASYMTLCNHIFYSPLKEAFYEGEDLDEIQQLVDPYSTNEIGTILGQEETLSNKAYYEDLENKELFYQDIAELLELRQTIAEHYGYDNYYAYRYAKTYQRAYSQTAINNYRKQVKDVCVDLILDIVDVLGELVEDDELNDTYYFYQYDKAINDTKKSVVVSDYFKTLKSTDYNIDFYTVVNEAFGEGRIFVGDANGVSAAFCQNTDMEGTYSYFANEDYYSALSTIVHEMGHYNFSYLDGDADFDTKETHSQSNEALFLNYICKQCGLSSEAQDFMILYYMYANLYTIIETCMVDEFEEALYKNYSSLNSKFEDGITSDEYSALASAISKSYGISIKPTNWDYYFCTSSCYENSYGISVVPCMTLFIKSMDSTEAAKACYYKALTYHTDEVFMGEDDKKTYLQILSYAGYDSPFKATTYTKIVNYVQGILDKYSTEE